MTSFSLTISTVWLGTSCLARTPLHVPGDLDDPVRIMPHQVGLDEVVGDPLRLVMVAACRREDGLDQLS